MNQTKRKLKQEIENLEILRQQRIKAVTCSYQWHRLMRLIRAKKDYIKTMEGKCRNQLG